MEPAAKPQYASVEQPLGYPPPRPHCPICGHPVVAVGEDSRATIDHCRHLAFVFVGEIAEFEYRSPEFRERTARRRVSELNLSKLRRFLERLGYGNRLLALEITYGGMACGPVWNTDVYGFDFGNVEMDEEQQDGPRNATLASNERLLPRTRAAD